MIMGVFIGGDDPHAFLMVADDSVLERVVLDAPHSVNWVINF